MTSIYGAGAGMANQTWNIARVQGILGYVVLLVDIQTCYQVGEGGGEELHFPAAPQKALGDVSA